MSRGIFPYSPRYEEAKNDCKIRGGIWVEPHSNRHVHVGGYCRHKPKRRER